MRNTEALKDVAKEIREICAELAGMFDNQGVQISFALECIFQGHSRIPYCTIEGTFCGSQDPDKNA